MIGSGIFIVSADIARHVGSPAALLMVWLASGLMTVAGALAYGELAAMMPQAGGQYVYLREAYGGLWAFLYGWTLILVIQTGTIAAVAVAFARFMGVFWSALGPNLWFGLGTVGLSGERLGAIAVIALLTEANRHGLNLGRALQNSFTSIKILSLIFITVICCIIAPNPQALHLNFGSAAEFLGRGNWSLAALSSFGAAMVGALFSADAWATVTFVAPEVRTPHRDIPLALTIGTAVVIALYLATNVAYLFELPVSGSAAGGATARDAVFRAGIAGAEADRVASAAMQVVWGRTGATVTAVLVMVSTFGAANGIILTGARVIYAMAHDGVLFEAAGRLNRASVPAVALGIQGAWAALLTLSGTYTELLDYVIFADLVFYVMTVLAVFVLRYRRPFAPRPYRAFGYPWVPAAYVIAAVALMADLLIVKPRFTWLGLLIVLSGAPVYALTVRGRRRPAPEFTA